MPRRRCAGTPRSRSSRSWRRWRSQGSRSRPPRRRSHRRRRLRSGPGGGCDRSRSDTGFAARSRRSRRAPACRRRGCSAAPCRAPSRCARGRSAGSCRAGCRGPGRSRRDRPRSRRRRCRHRAGCRGRRRAGRRYGSTGRDRGMTSTDRSVFRRASRPFLASTHLGDHVVAMVIRVVDVGEAVEAEVGMEGDREQPLLAAVEDLAPDVQERPFSLVLASDADTPPLLDYVQGADPRRRGDLHGGVKRPIDFFLIAAPAEGAVITAAVAMATSRAALLMARGRAGRRDQRARSDRGGCRRPRRTSSGR